MTGIRRALPLLLLAAAALACAFALERSMACPIQAPSQPLRSLYKLSERVVVARVGAREVLKVESRIVSFRIALQVTENVKGTPAQVLHLYHREFVVKNAETGEEELRSISFSGHPAPQLKRGERYLFFLDPRPEGDGYEVTDAGFGIKQLSDDDLKVYLERMKELADITRQEPENKEALVEWLVRCAEEPATRWEGAYELLESADAATAAPEPQPSADADEASTPEEFTEVPPESFPKIVRFRYGEADPTLAPLLNAVQKQRLADALFASNEPREDDNILMQVVKDFGDTRFPAFALARLHRLEDEAPPEAELWLRALAGSLKNRRLTELADSYSANTTYFEDEETEAATPPEEAAEVNNAADGDEEIISEAVGEPTSDEKAAARVTAAIERATRKRSTMLRALLTRLDLFIATGQLAEAQP